MNDHPVPSACLHFVRFLAPVGWHPTVSLRKAAVAFVHGYAFRPWRTNPRRLPDVAIKFHSHAGAKMQLCGFSPQGKLVIAPDDNNGLLGCDIAHMPRPAPPIITAEEVSKLERFAVHRAGFVSTSAAKWDSILSRMSGRSGRRMDVGC